jgi:hypothetical protein
MLLVIWCAIGVADAFSPSLLFFVLTLFIPVAAFLAIVVLVGAVVALLRRKMRWAAWSGALVLSLIVAPWPMLLAGRYSGWVVRLLVNEPSYDRQLSQLDGRSHDRLKLFAWGQYMIFDDFFLAYDESDQLRFPQNRETASFQSRFESALGAAGDGSWFVQARLWHHYYVVDAYD